jgi:hypothetical protein
MLQQWQMQIPSFIGFACTKCSDAIPLIPNTSDSLVATFRAARITVFAQCERCLHIDCYKSSSAAAFGDSAGAPIPDPTLRDARLERFAQLENHVA